MNRTNMRSRTGLLAILAAMLIAGCAGHFVHREGIELMDQGRYPEGLAKLSEAMRLEPNNMDYRKDLIRAREQALTRLIAAGNSERAAERYEAAQAFYERALELDARNARARTGLDEIVAARRQLVIVAEAEALLKKGDTDAAAAHLKPVFLENPGHGRALQVQRQINEQVAKRQGAAPTLRSNFRKPVTLQFRDANLRMVFESISRTSGINILIDKDVRADLKTSIFVKDTSVEDTIDLILLQNQLGKKVLSDNTIFVYPNLPAKTREYQDLKVRSFHLVNVDAKLMQAMIKGILKTKDIFINEKTNSLIMRDTPDAIALAEKLVSDQDLAEPEVMLEVEVLEVTHSRLSILGIQYPDSLTFTPPGGSAGAGGTGGGIVWSDRNSLAINRMLISPIPTLTFNAHLNDSDVSVLASPRIRVRNKEKAKIHVGDRVPIITNTSTPSAGGPVTTGSVQYIEVGLKLDVEPDIHPDGDVGIKLTMEVSTITGTTTTGTGVSAPQIGTRNASTVLRLKDGETQVLAGLINDSDRRSANKVPGLGELPILGRLFSTHTDDGQKTEIVLSITPRLMGRSKIPDAQVLEFWTGTEAVLRSEPLMLRQAGSIAMTTPAGTPPKVPAVPAPRAPTVPGAKPPAGTPPATSAAPAASVAAAVAAAAQSPDASGPMAFTWQGPAAAKVGSKITLTLNARSGSEVGNLGVVIGFDPAALKVLNVVEGSFLKQGRATSTFTQSVDAAAGQIEVEIARPADVPGAKGSGTVTMIGFEVIGAGTTSEVTVTRIQPRSTTGDDVPYDPPAAHTITVSP